MGSISARSGLSRRSPNEWHKLQAVIRHVKAIKASSRPNHFRTTHVWTQHFGDNHGTVRLLKVLEDGNPGAADRQARAVQGVDKLRFGPTGAAKTNVGAARLERFVV